MTHRATITTRSAWLGKEFGEELARRYFGDEIVDALPRFVRGKNAGKFKAEIEWIKVERGGWVSTGRGYEGEASEGYVENRAGKVIAARLILREWGQSEPSTEFARTGAPRDLNRFRSDCAPGPVVPGIGTAKFWMCRSSIDSRLSGRVVEADFSPTLYYYGTAVIAGDLTDAEAEDMGLYRWSDDSADRQAEAGALYRAEMAHHA